MRKKLILSAAVLAAAGAAALSSGGGPAAPTADSVLVIGDRRFLAQLDDLAVNPESYAGKTVRLEGFALRLGEDAPWRFAVARIFSCCGPDGYPVGLPCAYSGDAPEDDAWLEVEGVFRTAEGGQPFLEATKLTVKATPGRRNVFS